jgi:hypothetical protein
MAQTKSAGWYPAPDGNGQQWWNGVSWSETRQGAGGVGVAAVPVPPIVALTPTAPPPVYSAANPPPLVPGATPSASPFGVRTIAANVNRNAMIGFITGIISVFFNLLFLLAPIAIVFSIMGLSRARQLKVQGAPTTLAGFAWAGLGAGVFSALMGLIQVIVFVVSIATSIDGAASSFPASGLIPWLFQGR